MKDKFKRIFCVLFGHSNIETGFFGYWYCARCSDQLGDSLGGSYSNPLQVVVGHDCETCHKNWLKLTWRDKLFAPNPFRKPSQTA